MKEYIDKPRFEKEILILNKEIGLQAIEINSMKKQIKGLTEIIQYLTNNELGNKNKRN